MLQNLQLSFQVRYFLVTLLLAAEVLVLVVLRFLPGLLVVQSQFVLQLCTHPVGHFVEVVLTFVLLCPHFYFPYFLFMVYFLAFDLML